MDDKEPKVYKKMCRCFICGKQIEIRSFIPLVEDDCTGVTCKECEIKNNANQDQVSGSKDDEK